MHSNCTMSGYLDVPPMKYKPARKSILESAERRLPETNQTIQLTIRGSYKIIKSEDERKKLNDLNESIKNFHKLPRRYTNHENR